jgi:hypothetical protein
MAIAGFTVWMELPKLISKSVIAKSLGDIPEVFNYVVMSMKIVPNLEMAMSYAAFSSTRPLAIRLRKSIMSSFYEKRNLENLLEDFIDPLGEWGGHLKRGFYLIRSALNEGDEVKRIITLNRSLEVVLEGTREIMEEFSKKLHMPTLILYSMGIMIPLALIAMIPAVSVMGLEINSIQLILIYNILIPGFVAIIIFYIISQRPVSFPIPYNKTKRPLSKVILNSVLVVIAFIVIWWMNILKFLPSISYPIIAGVGMVSAILYSHSKDAKKRIDSIQKMEKELPDALFILGRRMLDGKSPEESFIYMSALMRGSIIGEIFQKASIRMMCLNYTIKQSLFSEKFEITDSISSPRTIAVMKLLTDMLEKSGEAAGSIIIRTADHLKDIDKVEEEMKKSLHSITTMMKATASIFAPLIGGITVSLAGIIHSMLAKTYEQFQNIPEISGISYISFGTSLPSVSTYFAVVAVFLLLLGFFLLLLVNGIEKGGNPISLMYELSVTFPTIMTIFIAVYVVSGYLFNMLLG